MAVSHYQTMTDTLIEFEATPVFYANQKAYESGKYRIIANQGSTRSSKTYSISQLLITIAQQEKKEISVVSQSLPHLKKGALKDFLSIMNDWQLYSENSWNRTDRVYQFDKSYIEFFGVDNEGKVKGPGRDILYINEADLISYDIYKQLALRTRGVIIIDYNPARLTSYVYDLLLLPGTKFIKSTYKQNLKFLTKFQIDEIEQYNPELYPETGDWNMWRVYGLGERAAAEAQIYSHWKLIDKLPDNPDETIYGLDFGFNNQTALVKVAYKDTIPYRKQLLYKSKLTNTDLIAELHNLIPNKKDCIYADAAEPNRIEEIKRAGFNVFPANKDVNKGIDHVKSKPMPVTKDSTDFIDELGFYSWKTDKNGKLLDEPVKIKDHLCDADRYAVFTHSVRPKYSFKSRLA